MTHLLWRRHRERSLDPPLHLEHDRVHRPAGGRIVEVDDADVDVCEAALCVKRGDEGEAAESAVEMGVRRGEDGDIRVEGEHVDARLRGGGPGKTHWKNRRGTA